MSRIKKPQEELKMRYNLQLLPGLWILSQLSYSRFLTPLHCKKIKKGVRAWQFDLENLEFMWIYSSVTWEETTHGGWISNMFICWQQYVSVTNRNRPMGEENWKPLPIRVEEDNCWRLFHLMLKRIRFVTGKFQCTFWGWLHFSKLVFNL